MPGLYGQKPAALQLSPLLGKFPSLCNFPQASSILFHAGMSNTAQSLSLERKIKMHEAREGIINRLAMTLPHAINLDRFLTVIVSELGRMMNVDRCDVIQLKSASELRISHEWRASDDVPSSLGTVIPLDLKQLSEHVNITKPIRLNDIAAADQKVRFLAGSL